MTAPLLTSVCANVTSNARQLSWIAVMRSSSAAASAAGPLTRQQLIRPAQLDERDRDVPVLRVGRLATELARVRRREQRREVDAGRVEERRHGLGHARAVREQHGARARLAEQARIEEPRGRRAERDLAGPRDRLGLDAGGHVGAGDDQLAVDPADEEEVELARMDADRHLQTDGPGRGGAPPHPRQRVLHSHCCRGRAQRMILAAEEQQNGVAAELEQVGMVRVGLPDQLGEGGVDHTGDLLGALAPALRERLGQIREAGDIGEHERSREALRLLAGRLAQPVDGDPRHERAQRIGRRVEPSWRHAAHRSDSLPARRGRRAPASRLKLRRRGVDTRTVNPTPDSESARAMQADALLDALLAQSGVGVTIVDRDLRIVRANQVFGVFGIQSTSALVGRTIAEAVPQLAAQVVPATLAVLATGVPAVAQELVARHPDDPAQNQYFRTFRCPVVAQDGSIAGVVSTIIEITDLKNVQVARDDALARQRESDAAELASRRAETEAFLRYRTIFDGASIGIIRVDRTGRVIEVNPALEAMLGYSAAEFAAMKFQEYTHADDIEENLRHFDAIMNGPQHAYQFEKRCYRKDGEMIWVRVTSAAERDANGERNYAITMLEDITERRLSEQRHREQAQMNEHQATHDALTGLGNRRKLYGDIERALGDGERRSFTLGLFDLDGFKAYNDAFGHPAGDALLARLGRRMAAVVGGQATAYRMGGDEFCVFTWVPDAARVVEDARLALCEQGEGFSIRCSWGSALVPSEATDLEGALQLADERLYTDKRTSRVSESRQVRNALVQLIAEQRHALGPNTVDVADLAAATASRLGLSREEVAATRLAAELHDIGKTALPESILGKAGPLDDEEWSFVKRHTIIGERIVAAAPALAQIAPIVRSTHERPDGTGYPDRLAGDAVPIAARIIAVVDAFDAMVSSRPYRAAMAENEALAELHRCAGTQFEASVVDAFAGVLAGSRRDLRAA